MRARLPGDLPIATVLLALAAFLTPLTTALVAAAPIASVQDACPVTMPNGFTPPGERMSANHHGAEGLWTVLWRDGAVVFEPGGSGFALPDGSLQMKWPWWRGTVGPLTIDGRRLDAAAPPLRARIPSGYGASGFQATSLVFPSPGCWEVTGHAGAATLRFVVNVIKIGNGPVWGPRALP
jgi:hypothetical protein